MTTCRHSRAASRRALPGFAASLAGVLVPLLLLVPAGLPLCDPGVEACAITVPVAPAGAHCPMETLAASGGAGPMECCIQDAAPPGPAPAAPAKGDGDLRAPFQASAPAPVAVSGRMALATVTSAPAATAAPTASPVPLYTLLSTLLS